MDDSKDEGVVHREKGRNPELPGVYSKLEEADSGGRGLPATAHRSGVDTGTSGIALVSATIGARRGTIRAFTLNPPLTRDRIVPEYSKGFPFSVARHAA